MLEMRADLSTRLAEHERVEYGTRIITVFHGMLKLHPWAGHLRAFSLINTSVSFLIFLFQYCFIRCYCSFHTLLHSQCCIFSTFHSIKFLKLISI